MTKQEFLNKFALAIVDSTQGTGLFPSVAIAQAALESGWGDKTMGEAHNLFGLKADMSWKGKVISTSTQEVLNGGRTSFSGSGKVYNNRAEAIEAGANSQTLFRYYPTFEDSVRDHNKFLKSNGRYARVFAAITPEEQARAIHNAGYATATNYADTLIRIITTNNLKQYDKKKV